MQVKEFVRVLSSDFYVGVPDSQLKPLCDYLASTYGIDPAHHIIAANEGNAVAIGAGYNMATGKIPVIYMQNSGEGNIINPLASLTNEQVYAIPMVLVIGWRGEPGVHDEPQHIFQGEVTLKLLDDMQIRYFVVDKETTITELEKAKASFNELLEMGKSIAFVIKKEALSYSQKKEYKNEAILSREEIIRTITKYSGDDLIISTTGKASRELYEIRENNHQSHKYDFLTVGSMGHASSIALGVAINMPRKKVWCIDGDGAAIMHMGALTVIGSCSPNNLVHVVINNGAHETVGGMPTAAQIVNLSEVAFTCGYRKTYRVHDEPELEHALKEVKQSNVLAFIEVVSSISSRKDLGRPTTTPLENKKLFEQYLREE